MENRCVSCGEVIPEGRLICPNCEKRPHSMNIQAGISHLETLGRRAYEWSDTSTYQLGLYVAYKKSVETIKKAIIGERIV